MDTAPANLRGEVVATRDQRLLESGGLGGPYSSQAQFDGTPGIAGCARLKSSSITGAGVQLVSNMALLHPADCSSATIHQSAAYKLHRGQQLNGSSTPFAGDVAASQAESLNGSIACCWQPLQPMSFPGAQQQQQQRMLLYEQQQAQQQQQHKQRQLLEAAAAAAHMQEQQLLLAQLHQLHQCQQQQQQQAGCGTLYPAAAAGASLPFGAPTASNLYPSGALYSQYRPTMGLPYYAAAAAPYGMPCPSLSSHQLLTANWGIISPAVPFNDASTSQTTGSVQPQQCQGFATALPPLGPQVGCHPNDNTTAGAANWTAVSSLQQQQVSQDSGQSSISRMIMPWQAAAGWGATAAAAAAIRSRWGGAMPMVLSPEGLSQETDAHSPALQCDEELQSVEAGGLSQQQQQQQRPNGSRRASAAAAGQQQEQPFAALPGDATAVNDAEFAANYGWIDETGSTHYSDIYSDDMDDVIGSTSHGPCQAAWDQQAVRAVDVAVVAAKAAAIAAEQAAAVQQSVVMDKRGCTTQLHRGTQAVMAAPIAAAAAAAGVSSVRGRLHVSEVSVYADCAMNSSLALEQANKLMANMVLPDGVIYMPVDSESFLFRAAVAWHFPAFVVCLGSSYLQRMLVRLPQLAEAALACPGFEGYCNYMMQKPETPPARLFGEDAAATLATLRSIQFTCLFVATKVADQVHALGLLRFMLTNLSHNGAVVSLQQAADVEARCLQSLEWRLGPFFTEDEQLHGFNEALWAECMGHAHYGTSFDDGVVDFGSYGLSF